MSSLCLNGVERRRKKKKRRGRREEQKDGREKRKKRTGWVFKREKRKSVWIRVGLGLIEDGWKEKIEDIRERGRVEIKR